jgi:hypothetical protein
VCDKKQDNLDIFEEFATLGWITENRFRLDGAASGFFPVVTLPQVRHVENMGGYSRLLNMTCIEAEDLADEGARLHTKWVVAKPYYTATIAKKAFQTATGDAEWSAHMGDQYQMGRTAKQRRVRPPVNFRARFCPDGDVVNGVAWGQRVE